MAKAAARAVLPMPLLALVVAVLCPAPAGADEPSREIRPPEARVDLKTAINYRYSSGYRTIEGQGCLKETIAKARAETLRECRAICNRDPRCGAATFNPARGLCHVKPNCRPDQRKSSDSNVSIVKRAFEPLSPAVLDAYSAWRAARDGAKAPPELKAEADVEERDGHAFFGQDGGDYRYAGDYTQAPGFSCSLPSIYRLDAESTAACQAICSADIRCGAVTFNTRTARCSLKPQCRPRDRVEKPDNVLAAKNRFRPPSGEQIAAFLAATRPPGEYRFAAGKLCEALPGQAVLPWKPAEEPTECRRRCDANPFCNHFAYRVPSRMCRLFQACDRLVDAKYWVTESRTNR